MRPPHEMPRETRQIHGNAGLIVRGVNAIGTRTRRIGRKPSRPPIIIRDIRCNDARIDDRDQWDGRQEWGIGPREHEANGARASGGHIFGSEDWGKCRRRRPVHAQQTAEGINHIFRGHIAAILELDASAQREIPSQTISAGAMAFRQPRYQLRWITLIAIKAIIGVEQYELARYVKNRVWIERSGKGIAPD